MSLERWLRHRERMLVSARAGWRPTEWWEYEATIPWPGSDNETVALYDAGLLTDEEIAELMPFWRAQFERANSPSFFFVRGPQDYLEGEPARRAHYRWAQIPRAVLTELREEERRRKKRLASAGLTAAALTSRRRGT